MLNKLLEKINTIYPKSIIKITKLNNSISLTYRDPNTLSEEDISIINSIVAEWPLEESKLEKIKLLDINWKNKLKSGWQTPYGYNLGIDVSDVALLTGAFTLAKEANNMGITDPTTIVDIAGHSHSLSLQDLTVLMLQYGQARALLSNSYATIKQSINSAASNEELEAININL